MPGRDQIGPHGRGSGSGKGLGRCSGINAYGLGKGCGCGRSMNKVIKKNAPVTDQADLEKKKDQTQQKGEN